MLQYIGLKWDTVKTKIDPKVSKIVKRKGVHDKKTNVTKMTKLKK